MFLVNVNWGCPARQSISVYVLYNREFKSDDKINISAEEKEIDVTIATDDHNRDFSFCHIRFLTDVTNALIVYLYTSYTLHLRFEI